MTICSIHTKKNVQWNDIGMLPKQQLQQPQPRHCTDQPNDGGGPPADVVVVAAVLVVVVVVVVVLGDGDGEVYSDDNAVEVIRRLLLLLVGMVRFVSVCCLCVAGRKAG